jgi:hypothetical protein
MTPYKCPACDGFGKRVRKVGGKKKRCLACHGTCVVWSQDVSYPWTLGTGYGSTDTVVDTGVQDTTWANVDGMTFTVS